jgi:hypothetical protein
MTRTVRDGDQALPVHNDHPVVQDVVISRLIDYGEHTTRGRQNLVGLVIEDVKQRTLVGIERYGTPLQPWNGRDALRDAYEEVLDLLNYLEQLRLEGVGTALMFSSARSIALELRGKIAARGA